MTLPSSHKNNGTLFVFIIVLVIFLAGIISYLYLKQKVTAPDLTTGFPATSTPQISGTKHYVDNNLKLSFDYPNIFELMPGSGGVITTLRSKYFVKVNFVKKEASESFPPHYFAITFKHRNSDFVEAMKRDNQFIAETYNDFILNKKPKSEVMEITQVDGKTAYSFTLGSEGINSKYFYIPRSSMETTIITFTYIGDSLVSAIKPAPVSEEEQLKIFNNLLTTIKFN